MKWAFRILAALNGVLLVVALFYQAPGEDPAGEGMRLGFAVFFAIALAIVLLLYRVVKTNWVRGPLLAIMALPVLSIGYGIWLSF